MSLRDRFVRQAAPIGLLVAVFGAGCILLPIGGYKPYKVKEIGFIRVGVTTKDEVIGKLGAPRATLLPETGSLLVYESHGVTKWFFGWVGGYEGGSERFDVSYCFVLRVHLNDEDTVSRTDVTKVRSSKFFNSKDCPAEDLCYDRGTWMFLASREMDRRITESGVPSDLCAVFIYSDVKLFVTMDDELEIIRLNEESFARRLVSPGPHQTRRYLTEFEFECEAGSRYYLRVASDGSMQSVDEDVGRDDIGTRRLLLTAQGS